MSSSALPSKIVDRKFVSIPPEEDLVDSYGWEDCGKWILTSAEADLDFLDKTWNDLQPLLEDGTLLMLKSSTALLKSETVVIQCFTRAGKEEAKRTARVIRSTVDFRGIMYYKMNRLTKAKIGRRFGQKHISVYMHTYCGRFYVKNPTGDWILEEHGHRREDVPVSSRFRRENNLGCEDLPSTGRTFMKLPSDFSATANWHLKCSSSDTAGEFLPGADRVWMVAKELLEEDHLTGISWCKNASGVEERFYVPASSPVSSQLSVCDRIRRGASVQHVMYFTRGNESNIKYTYKYTAEGELYEQTKFAEKFVLQREFA